MGSSSFLLLPSINLLGGVMVVKRVGSALSYWPAMTPVVRSYRAFAGEKEEEEEEE